MYTYKITNIYEQCKWIYIKCIEEDSMLEVAPFVELVKQIAQKWNNNNWEGNIFSIGEMRYKIKNDPLELIYQWDDLFGIILDYTAATSIDNMERFLSENYGIKK